MKNEIIIDQNGNKTVIGKVAHEFYFYLNGESPKVFKLTQDEKFFVFEQMDKFHYVHRASLTNKQVALNYMGKNRILVYREN